MSSSKENTENTENTKKTENAEGNNAYHLLIGTYTQGKSEGIYVYRFDGETGAVTHEYTAKGVENPSFLTVSPDGQYVYAVNELSGAEGTVSAFGFDGNTGELTYINQQPSGGEAPCYLTVDEGQNHVIVGNYTGGNLAVLPIEENGALGAPVQIIQHEGSGKNKERQEKAHVHSTVFTPNEAYLFVGDLGTDKVYAYAYNPEADQPLSPAEQPFTSVTPGAGPRHLVFDASGDHAYVVQELSAEVNVYDHKDGELTLIQTLPMTSEDFNGAVGAAAIRISPDGKFLYASNRGDANNLVIYKIDPKKGTLTFVERQSTLGKGPRDFLIDPTGNFLLVAHQYTDSIVLFKRDKNTGKLTPMAKQIEIGSPVYLKMVPVE